MYFIAFISIKNMKWKFGNMYQISFDDIKHFWNQETNTTNKKLFYFQVKRDASLLGALGCIVRCIGGFQFFSL